MHARLALWMFARLGAAVARRRRRSRSSIGDSTIDAAARRSAIALVVGGLGFLAKTFIQRPAERRAVHPRRRDKLVAVAIGAVCGFVVGLTSVG